MQAGRRRARAEQADALAAGVAHAAVDDAVGTRCAQPGAESPRCGVVVGIVLAFESSTQARRDFPLICNANGRTVVLPPAAAERVPLSKSSAMIVPSSVGCAICTCPSTPPGKTSSPDASIS